MGGAVQAPASGRGGAASASSTRAEDGHVEGRRDVAGGSAGEQISSMFPVLRVKCGRSFSAHQKTDRLIEAVVVYFCVCGEVVQISIWQVYNMFQPYKS